MQNEPNLVRRRRIANERKFFYNNELWTKNYELCQQKQSQFKANQTQSPKGQNERKLSNNKEL